MTRALVALCALCGCCVASCASEIPKGRYGVESLKLQGVEKLDAEAIKSCLATEERPRLRLMFGPSEEPRCGVPPFDAARLPISFWAWPWTDWPLYDPTIFERDQSRIERWYQARGYYDAAVTRVATDKDEDGREISLTLTVEEGDPVRVSQIDVRGLDALDSATAERVRSKVRLVIGEPFDEATYDSSKRALLDAVREASYAKAKVEGHVLIDPTTKSASVAFMIALGPACKFGKLRVSGQENMPARTIWAAADIREGQPFSRTALDDAKRAIYALGPFASVELEEKPRENEAVVDVLIKVVPGRLLRFAIGGGTQIGSDWGVNGDDGTNDPFRLWDVHLLAKVEHRNFLGGMRRISVEDRPRLIFDEPFPSAPSPTLGNLLIVDFRQPAFAEPRTTLLVNMRWDRGPDPFGGKFSRSDLVAGFGPERKFLHGRLTLTSTLNVNLFIPDERNKPYPDYTVTYFQHSAVLELRNDPRNPRRGAYFAASFQHAGYFLPSDWDYLRFAPEARGYVPLPFGIVLASRLRVGLLAITDSDIVATNLNDPDGYLQRLRDLGPLRQRLRGGGHNSVRGYEANTLGDVVQIGKRLDSGGIRQWEVSTELRIPITSSFGTVLFVDLGDVTEQKAFRLDAPQTTFGFGIRYHTIVGPLRLDAGFAPRSLQTIGGDPRTRERIDPNTHTVSDFPESHIFGTGGAIHFTIGEAF
ncbi:MAG TPA: BamA/TamA family outer membrane protein [Polyangiales bacterium]|nr:BamA/TamA family outer membrane protein [Polyangiales bacterium]